MVPTNPRPAFHPSSCPSCNRLLRWMPPHLRGLLEPPAFAQRGHRKCPTPA